MNSTTFKSPKATVVAIIQKEDKILLTQRNIPPYQGAWCLPGGHIDPNEKALTAVIREVKEETGLNYEAEFFDYFDEIIPELDIHAVALVFKGAATGKLKPDVNEVKKTRWLSPEEALNYHLAFQHEDILRKIYDSK